MKMHYKRVVEAEFIHRPNRFIAHVLLNGHEEIVHVKNTGRCKELLVPGTRVVLEESQNPHRRTKYSLVAVYKGKRLINMDSQAPNAAAFEALLSHYITDMPEMSFARREVRYGQSRFDVGYTTVEGRQGFMEVKGVTLEENGVALFPDAPTTRGTKHLKELVNAVRNGYAATVLFVIQMTPVLYFTPNGPMDIEFTQALQVAANEGVKIIAYDCLVTPDSMFLENSVPVRL